MRPEVDEPELVRETRLALERELETLVAAIELVASGRSPRVTLANLRFAAVVLPRVEPEARLRGVRIRKLWPAGEGEPIDLAIERESDRG